MNFRNSARTFALASMLALSIAGLPAAHAHAAPNDSGGGNSDTRPVGASCMPMGDYVLCTTPEGGMWRCENAYDPTACVNINPSPQLQAGARPVIVQPVLGSALDPGMAGAMPSTPHLPMQAVFPAP